MSDQQFPYGGQAVLEGVMIRGQHQATVAVRRPAGDIVYKHFPLDTQRRSNVERVPLVRGIVMLWDMLGLGMQALNFSASVATGEHEEASTKTPVGSLIIAFVLAIGLFFVLPLLLAHLAEYAGASPLLRESIEGVVRLALIIGYLVAISRVPEIERVFGYHGAEHKAVNAYEARASLTVDSVRRFTLLHPRCGTSFLLVIVVISFVVFLFLGGLPFWAKVLSRIVLIPVIAALAYELLRLSAANYHRAWVRVLVAPSLALQKLTTREPDDGMIATAIAALRAVLSADGIVVQDAAPEEKPVLVVST